MNEAPPNTLFDDKRQERKGTKVHISLFRVALVLFVGVYFFLPKGKQGGDPANIRSTAPKLTVEPADWWGPIGSRVQFVVSRHDGPQPVVVQSGIAVSVENPKVMEVAPFETTGKALCPGPTVVSFIVDGLTAKANVRVDPRTPPRKLIVQPEKLDLGVGTTGQLKAIGVYDDGRQVDLTEDASWKSENSSLFVYQGRVEAAEAGSGVVRVRYRSHEKLEPLEASVPVNVVDHQYKALKLTIEPASLRLGEPGLLRTIVVAEDGSEFSLDDSSGLTIESVLKGAASFNGPRFTAKTEGDLTLSARFRQLTASVHTTIHKSESSPRMVALVPRKLDLKVGERAPLKIALAQQVVRVESMEPEIAEVTSDGYVIGRKEGNADIEVVDASGSMIISVNVTAVEWKALFIEPPVITFRPYDSLAMKVYGSPGGANRIELATDQLSWVQLPRPDFVEFDGSSFRITGLRPTGDRTERLTVRLHGLMASSEIAVVPSPKPLPRSVEPPSEPVLVSTATKPVSANRLKFFPEQLKMKVGEVARLGHEVFVRRKESDLSDTCEVHSSSSDGVVFDADTRSLQATLPGRTQLTAIVYDQLAYLDVIVESDACLDPQSTIIVEPQTKLMAVGERFRPQIYAIGTDGSRTLVAGLLISNSPDVAATSGSTVQGLTPGQVTFEAVVPGIGQTGKTQLVVEQRDFEGLVFQPSQLTMAVGQQKHFRVYGVTSNGDVELGDHPDLKFALSDSDGNKVSLWPSSRNVQALRPGQANIKARWKGLEASLATTMHFDFIDDLFITPSSATIEAGSRVDYQVFTKRSGRLQPLQLEDGLQLFVDDTATAISQETRLGVTGLKPGITQVTTRYGSLRAAVPLTVVSRSTRNFTNEAGLYFASGFAQMDLTDPGISIRVLKVFSDGTTQNVSDQATYTVREPNDVIEMDQTPLGPVVRPRNIGLTYIDATVEGTSTHTPILVRVGPLIPREAELHVNPGALHLRVNEVKRFAMAKVFPASGGDPIPIPFDVLTNPNRFIEISPDSAIRGIASGSAVVVLTTADVEGRFSGATTSATVEVGDLRTGVTTATSTDTLVRKELVLTCPSVTNVGSKVSVRVEMIVNGESFDVTNHSQLTIVSGNQESLDKTNIARKPGRISIQASHDNLVSAPLEIDVR